MVFAAAPKIVFRAGEKSKPFLCLVARNSSVSLDASSVAQKSLTVLIVEKAAIIVNIILRALKIENGKLFYSFPALHRVETSLESLENNFVLSSLKYILPWTAEISQHFPLIYVEGTVLLSRTPFKHFAPNFERITAKFVLATWLQAASSRN